ncbi:MAG TPA: autorepressor SdpR family transcription factor [Gemmatimonadota bacterium]|nr:autorepressor SdpR family transcription factor [Gemmatimonadota bacterium]
MDATIRALADPTRREILRMLRERDLAAGEIAARFAMTAPTVSHHLSVLKDAGLVQTERNGRSVVYSIDTTVVQEFLGEMMRFFGRGGEQ